ncbi:MAG: hypothetical protein GY820_13220 [Gammaproteobacteria bacterium]|nr:hypothetical protein [Gammaproteobacteria bacterium]
MPSSLTIYVSITLFYPKTIRKQRIKRRKEETNQRKEETNQRKEETNQRKEETNQRKEETNQRKAIKGKNIRCWKQIVL